MKIRWLIPAFCLALFAWPSRAQQQNSQQKPQDSQDSSSSSSSSLPPTDSRDNSDSGAHSKHSSAKSSSSPSDDFLSNKVVNPKDPSTWDPYGAYHDVDVGNFYKAKGDQDAAIGRYQDAIRLKPDFAKPRLLLAEIYEKRHDDQIALKYYKEYLQVLPNGPDAKKVQKKIEKLSSR